MQSPLIVLKDMNKEEKTKVLEEIINDIKPLIKEMYKETSKITLLESEVDEYETMTITLCGGLNGSGEWNNYFNDLARIFEELKEKGFDVWVINLENDCLDDIFYCKTGITKKENE